MKEGVPIHILDYIVHELSPEGGTDLQSSNREDVKSLCLVSKSWVRPCQDNLFNSVMLHPARANEGGDAVHALDYTSRFAALMAISPHIGAYVRKLTYRLVQWETPELEMPEVAFVLEQLKNVVEFTLVVEEVPRDSPLYWRPCFKLLHPSHFNRFPRHARALSAILGLPTLKSLTLQNVELPSAMLYNAAGLQTLDLQRSYVIPPSPLAPGPKTFCSGEPIKLKTLKLDADSSNPMMAVILRHFYTPKSYGVSFADLETLSIAVGPPPDPDPGPQDEDEEEGEPEYATSYILRRTTALKELYLHDAIPIVSSFGYAESPLQGLHRASWSTLRKLSYEIRMLIGERDTSIPDPYHCLFKDGALSALSGLEDLRLHIWMGGRVPSLVVDAGLIEALGELDGVLGQRLNPRLRKVKLVIELHTEPTSLARELATGIQTTILDVVFPRLHKLAEDGELKLTLDVHLYSDRVSGVGAIREDDDED